MERSSFEYDIKRGGAREEGICEREQGTRWMGPTSVCQPTCLPACLADDAEHIRFSGVLPISINLTDVDNNEDEEVAAKRRTKTRNAAASE